MTDPSSPGPPPVTPESPDPPANAPTLSFPPPAEGEPDVGTRVWSSDTPPGPAPALAPAPLPSGQVPGYEIQEKLGEGGMGVVYKARQQRLNRVVALKMVRMGGHARAEELVRFLAEAEAVARLQHPNIVQVYDVGQHDGLPFFSLEFVGGGTLADRLAAGPLAPAEAARIVEQLARAVGYAHSRGVVHRDLKPANVLMAGIGDQESGVRKTAPGSSLTPDSRPLTPKVTDFGLAKQLGGSGGVTQSGAIMGTPSYMAPEQASGDTASVGPAADVYGLGAILYECLTGRPPFQAAAPLDVVLQVTRDEPVRPRVLNPAVPRDLETISLRCLEKSPARRYPSADELADDLRRFLDNEPIRARPVGPVERAVKWARRRPTAAALVAVCFLAPAAVAVALAVSNARVNVLYLQTQEALTELEREQERTRAALAGEQDALQKSRQALTALTAEEKKTRGLLEKQERSAYRSAVLLAEREADAPTTGRLEELLGGTPPHLRRWEWFALDRLARPARHTIPYRGPEAGGAVAVGWAGGGTGLVTRAGSELVWWDAAGREQSRTVVPPGGVASADGVVAWLDPAGRKLMVRRPGREPPEAVELPDPGCFGLTASDSGPFLAAQRPGNRLAVWEVRGETRPAADLDLSRPAELRFGPKGLVRSTPDAGPGRVTVRWGPGGALAAVTERDGKAVTLAAYRPGAGKPLLTLHAEDGYDLTGAGWDPGGNLFGALWDHWLAPEGGAEPETHLKVWDTGTGAELRRVAVGPRGGYAIGWDLPSSQRSLVAVAPADNRQVPGGVWDARTGELVCRLAEPTPHTTRLAFLPPDGRLLTAGPKVRVWSGQTGKPVATLDGDDVLLAERPAAGGGTRLLGTSRADGGGPGDRVGRVWDAATGRVLLTMKPRDREFTRLEWSPDGTAVATAEPGLVRVWDLPAPATPAPPAATPGPDGRSWVGRSSATDLLLSGTGIAEVQTPAGRFYYTGHVGGPVGAVAWSADGTRVATCSGDVTVKIWSPDTAAELRVYRRHPEPPTYAWWAAGDRRVITHSAAGASGHELRVWDPDTGADVARLVGPVPQDQAGRRVVVTRDGRRLVTAGFAKPGAGDPSAVRVWDPETGELVREFTGFPAVRLAVSADGSRVAAVAPAAAGEPPPGRVWDVADGRLVWSGGVTPDEVVGMGMSPDGSRLAVADHDRVHLLDAATGRPVSAAPHPIPNATWVVFSPDGAKLLAASTGTASEQHAGRTDVLSAADGRLLRSIDPAGDETRMALFHWSPDSKRLGGTVFSKAGPPERQTVLAVDAETGERVGRVADYHSGFIRMFRWAPDGRRAATASYDRTAKVWDFETGRTVAFRGHAGELSLAQHPAQTGWSYYRPPPFYTQPSLRALAWSPDGRLVASAASVAGSASPGGLRIWEPGTGRTLVAAPLPGGPGAQLEFGPGGRFLLVRTQAAPPAVWEVATEKKVCDLRAGTAAVVWSEDGARVAALYGAAAVEWSEDGVRGVRPPGAASGELVLWDLAAGTPGRPIPFTPESGALSLAGRDVAPHPDGRLALATPAGVEVWDGPAGRKRFTAPGLRGPLAWGPDGRLAAASADPAFQGTVVLAPDGDTFVKSAQIPGPAASLLWTPDGSRLIAGRPGRGPAVCDPATGEVLLSLKGPTARLAWAADGRALLGFDQPTAPAPAAEWPASPAPPAP